MPLISTLARLLRLTNQTTVESQFWRVRGRESYGYVESQGKRNALIKRWKWRGITVWRRVIDVEEVPSSVWISAGALGFYDGPWRSKFSNSNNYR